MKYVSSKDNALFKLGKELVRSSAYRRKTGLTVLEGIHLVQAWLASEHPQDWADTQLLLVTEQTWHHPEAAALLSNVPEHRIIVLTDMLYGQLSELSQTVPLMLVIKTPSAQVPQALSVDSIVLDAIQDAGNVGSILRTAAAAGIKYAFCTVGTAAVWSPKVLRAGMGAQLGMTIVEQLSTDEIIQRIQVPLLATSLQASHSIYETDLTSPAAWVFGNEGAGVSASLLAHSQAVHIPQSSSVESLNVAAAAAVCLFETVRQRSVKH